MSPERSRFAHATASQAGSKATRRRVFALEQALASAQAEASATRQLLAQALREVPVGILLVDGTQRVRLANEPLLTLYGLAQPPAHWLGQPAAQLEAQLRAQLAEPAALDHLLAHPAPDYMVLPRPGRPAVALKVTALAPEAGGGYLLCSHSLAAGANPTPALPRPGSEPAHAPANPTAEQQLPQQQGFLGAVLDTIPAVVFVYDAQGNVQFRNQAMRALQALAPAWQPLAPAAAQQPRTGSLPGSEECVSLASGAVRWLQLAHCPLAAAAGEPLLLGIGTDITALKHGQHALQHAKEVAEAAAQAKEVFLATMSHEIRTPLNGVLGMAAQLAKTPLTSQQQQLLSIVRTSGHFLLTVLNDVLDMSKITSGRLELEPTPFEFCQVASEALALLAWQARDKGLDFKFTPVGPAAPYPWVVGDSHRLSQVLVNLVGNALKFTRQGYVHVRSQVLAHTDEALTLQVEVADSGIGIAADKQEAVFELFTQASPDTQRQYGGSGLGLSLCRTLVQRMDGTLHVASQPGVGSTFTLVLTLPKALPTLRPAAPLAPACRAGSLAGLRVLLVDDNELSRSVVRYLLEHWGTALQEAGGGPEALALLEAQPFDVVLLDIELPGLSGLEVLARLRRHPDPQRAATPAIAFTANAFRADTARYLAAGFADCLLKPFAEADLYRLLQPYQATPPTVGFDLTYLRAQAQGNQALITKIIGAFMRNTPPLVQELRAAATAGHWDEVVRLAHHLRSTIQVLGIGQLEGCLAALQLPLPAGPGAAATAFGQAAHQLADHLDAVAQTLAG